jgi:hypothetical protein
MQEEKWGGKASLVSEEKESVTPAQSVMVFTSPPGGAFDPTGALANFVPITLATAGQVLTSDGVGASWQAVAGPGGASLSAHWGDSAASFLLPINTTTTLPIDTIDINPSGTWSIVNAGFGLEYKGSAGLFLISVAAAILNTGAGTTQSAAFQLFNGVTQLSSVPFLQGSTGPIVVSSAILANLNNGNILSAAVLNQGATIQVVGNSLGSAPHSGVQYTIIRVA